jgi:hypothetical protein
VSPWWRTWLEASLLGGFRQLLDAHPDQCSERQNLEKKITASKLLLYLSYQHPCKQGSQVAAGFTKPVGMAELGARDSVAMHRCAPNVARACCNLKKKHFLDHLMIFLNLTKCCSNGLIYLYKIRFKI